MAERNQPPRRSVEQIIADIEDFRKIRVLVVGDFFVDEYIEGEMFEISKEGPIPVIRQESRVRAAGAAGNLASSIRNLGAQVATVGVIGDDANGRALVEELGAKGIETDGLVVEAERPTLTYTKIRARVENAPSQEILRVDILPGGPLPARVEEQVLVNVRQRAAAVDGVIVLDQVHCLITPRLLDVLAEESRRLDLHLQGSSREHIGSFHHFSLIIPNDAEAAAAVGGDPDDARHIDQLGEELQRRGNHRQVLLTLGPDGMALFPAAANRDPVVAERIPSFATEVVDVTGAGDAVSATALLGSLSGWDLSTTAWTASHAAAIVLRHVGTHHVSKDELQNELRARG